MRKLAAVLALVCTASSAGWAADPQFCSDYARSAIRQYHANLVAPGCFRGADLRWNASYGTHYGWCLTASYAAVDNERAYRAMRLGQCRRNAY